MMFTISEILRNNHRIAPNTWIWSVWTGLTESDISGTAVTRCDLTAPNFLQKGSSQGA